MIRPFFALSLLSLTASAIEIGTLKVTQLANNNNTLDSATPGIAIAKGPGSTAGGLILSSANRGDYNLDFGRADDSNHGILLSSIAQLSRNDSATGGPAPGEFFSTSSFGISAATGKYWIAVHWAGYGDSIEANADVSYAYLPYDRFLGGFAVNDANNGPLTRFTGSPGIEIGTHFTDPADTNGRYHLDFTHLVPSASQQGVLLVTGARNEDNYALSRANADGSFDLFCHDNCVNGSSYENDGVGFAYLPAGAAGNGRLIALGRVNGDGSTDVSGGSFTVTKGGTGRWFLSIPGHSQATGTLIVSPEGGDTYNVDNIVAAGWDAANHRWIIESRDLTGADPQVPALQNMARPDEDAFSFAFFTSLPVGNPPQISATAPANDAVKVPLDAPLSVTAGDPDGDPLTVTFHGRRVGGVEPTDAFTVVALPDTQFYSENSGGNRAAIFSAQTDWIVAEKDARNIGFVLHLGDITQRGDNPATAPNEWANASAAMYRLENPLTTGLDDGIPYIMAVGNHDQTPIGDADGTTIGFNTYFGVHPETGINHFDGKAYYGGTSEPSKADNNYTLFTAGGMDFIVISLEYDTTQDQADLDWADALLKAHPHRRGIVITHYLVRTGDPAPFGAQGLAIYNALKDNPNLILMHGGHIHGEGQRSDTYQGRTIHSLLADYQGRSNGGDGWLRILKFRPSLNRIDISTYSPVLDAFETDADSRFSLDVDLQSGLGPFQKIATVSQADGTVTATWPHLEPGTRYEWYATVSDGVSSINTPIRSFITGGMAFPPVVEIASPGNGAIVAQGQPIPLRATANDIDGAVSKVEYYDGSHKIGESAAAPYEFTWTGGTAGGHTLIAKAVDNEGNVGSSTPVFLQIVAPSPVPEVTSISTGLFHGNWTVGLGSPAPYTFNSPGTNLGDLRLRVNGTAVPFLSGVIAVSNWETPLNAGVDSIDNLPSPYADASGNAWVNVYDNSNPNDSDSNPSTSEESAGIAVASFRYAAGWTGASVSAEGLVLGGNLPPGAAVQRVGDGLYALHGVATSGNLLAFPNGNSGVDADNVLSVRTEDGKWLVEVRDNSSTPQNGSFTFLHVPSGTPGVFSGLVRSNGALVALNDLLSSTTATLTKTADAFELQIGDGTQVNPGNAALFLTGDTTGSGLAADNIHSWSSAGNAFRIFSQDLPELTGAFQAVDLRFIVVPFRITPSQAETLPTVEVVPSDPHGGEHGNDRTVAFTFRREGPTSPLLIVSYATSGKARAGSDYSAPSGRIVIPAGESSVTLAIDILSDNEVEGDEDLTLTLNQDTGYRIGNSRSATAWIADRPWQAFLHAASASRPEDDEDGDGLSNLLEYFHGGDPLAAGNKETLQAIRTRDGTFTARFPRAKIATDVQAVLEWSTDLSTWRRTGESDGSRTAAITLASVSPPEEDPEKLEATLTFTAGSPPPSVYLRLVVTP